VTEFPELQQALVGAARRRYGRAPRAWRLARPVLIAAACAAAVVAVILLAGTHAPEKHSVAPTVGTADTLEAKYGVFRRPATDADRLPDVEEFKRYWLVRDDRATFDPAQTRLVAQDGNTQVFLVGITMDGREALCGVVYGTSEVGTGGCSVIASPIGRDVFAAVVGVPAGAQGATILAAVPDGVDEVIVIFDDHSTEHVAVRDNAVYATFDRWPVSIAWDDADGQHHVHAVWPEDRRAVPGNNVDGGVVEPQSEP
jgi:hypothetical protein